MNELRKLLYERIQGIVFMYIVGDRVQHSLASLSFQPTGLSIITVGGGGGRVVVSVVVGQVSTRLV